MTKPGFATFLIIAWVLGSMSVAFAIGDNRGSNTAEKQNYQIAQIEGVWLASEIYDPKGVGTFEFLANAYRFVFSGTGTELLMKQYAKCGRGASCMKFNGMSFVYDSRWDGFCRNSSKVYCDSFLRVSPTNQSALTWWWHDAHVFISPSKARKTFRFKNFRRVFH